jgi:polysaccharide deacetylase family protein (PEP-CTERM system associated)
VQEAIVNDERPTPRFGMAHRMVTAMRPSVEHIFTVDVEEYFQVAAFERVVAREDWASYPSRIETTIDRLLDLLARSGATGTFFTLGWIGDRYPRLVRRIHDAGHEIASHGYWHRRVDSLNPRELRDELRSSKAVLEDACGAEVLGFRAPNFSIRPGHEWAFDILLEEGYRYDSSLFPIRRPGYGYHTAPPVPHLIHRAGGSLCELPLATTRWRNLRIPAAGGAYLRHLPYAVIRRAFREHSESGIPATFYIHPWELDPEQPRLRVSWPTRMRHYSGLTRTIPRLERLLAEFRFSSAARCLKLHPPARSVSAKVSNAAD